MKAGTSRRLQVQYRKLDELLPWARNARTHSDAQIAQIAASVREWGFTNPVLVDEHGGIIAGHGRVLAARKLELVDVPTIVLAGLTEAQKAAYVIADNRLALNAGWDLEMLGAELQRLDELEFDVALLGFDDKELDQILRDYGSGAGEVVEDEPPEPPKDPVTKLGDVWLLGQHRLVCGDCTDPTVLSALCDGRKAGLMVTDPPYGVSVVGGTHDPRDPAYRGKTATERDPRKTYAHDRPSLMLDNDQLTGADLQAFLCRALENVVPVLARGASWYVWFAGTQMRAFIGATDLIGGFRHQLVWVKPNFAFGRCDYHYRHEVCFYGWTEGAAHTWLGDRKQSSVFELARDGAVAPLTHPTVKPVALYSIPIANHLGADGLLIDPFAGSGPAFSAAEQLGRTCYGVELSPAYCDVIVERWQALTSGKATRASR